MYKSNGSLIVILVVGIVAGWLAGQIVRGGGFGLIGDLIVGIIGAFIGDWLLPRLNIHLSGPSASLSTPRSARSCCSFLSDSLRAAVVSAAAAGEAGSVAGGGSLSDVAINERLHSIVVLPAMSKGFRTSVGSPPPALWLFWFGLGRLSEAPASIPLTVLAKGPRYFRANYSLTPSPVFRAAMEEDRVGADYFNKKPRLWGAKASCPLLRQIILPSRNPMPIAAPTATSGLFLIRFSRFASKDAT
jgi:uncharacterized membrane protein YeaQ/YmgE (transglycosylase-associated protein family)